jgi:hypothetical protein
MKSTMGQGCIPKGIQDQSKFRVSFQNNTIQDAKVCFILLLLEQLM